MSVLVVDDDPDVRYLVRHGLERARFEVVEAGDAEGALQVAQGCRVDVAVLDLDLPGMTGLKLMSELRRRYPGLHVIILTAAISEADRVQGLASGADDYVVKPFSAPELAARVAAVGRRRAQIPAAVIDTSGLRIDIAARAVSVDGQPVELTPREFDLLRHLAVHPDRAFSRAELLRAVWASSSEWQSEATVTEHVRRLRSKIEVDPANPARIVTVRGTGYRFASVASTTSPPVAHPATGGVRDATVVVVDGKIVHANPAALELVGAAQVPDVVGREFFDFVAPRSLGAAVARQQGATRGRTLRPDLITMVRLDGVDVLVEIVAVPVVWDGQPASQVTLWELGDDTSKLRELAVGIHSDVAEAIIITDTRLRIQSFNPAAEVLYGWREEEVIGRGIMEVLPWLRADATTARARESFQRHGRWHGDIVQRRRDGRTVTVRSSSTLLRDNGGRPVGIVLVNRPVGETVSRPALHRSSSHESLGPQILRGIQRGEFTVHYQPIVRLDDDVWQGVEALVRWQHPDRGLLKPAAFIDAAERSGVITDLGQFVMEEAGQQWLKWRHAGIDLHVAVNLSGRQLAAPDLVDRVGGVIAATSMAPGALWFEVTETSLVEDLDHATDVLRRITNLGACISIDDFGTGWASLTYLREFPVHALKIDRVFVAGLGKSITDTAIVSSIISLGLELGLSLVAEGIETTSQLDRLRSLGCELGQGYLFGGPQPPDRLAADSRSRLPGALSLKGS